MSDPRIEAAAAVLHGFGTSTLPFEEAPESNRRELMRKAAAALDAADAVDPLRSPGGNPDDAPQANGWHREEDAIRESIEARLARHVLPANFWGASIYNGVSQVTLDSPRLEEIAERCAPLLTEAVLNALAQLAQPCSGAVDCLAPSHTHGCTADTGSASCTEPAEHAVGRGVLAEDGHQATGRAVTPAARVASSGASR